MESKSIDTKATTKMFAVGHTALGYIIGKACCRATGQNQDIPLILTLSLLPDIDLIIPGLQHRGPTHSIILALLIFTPLLITKRSIVFPYLAVLISHSLIGDYLTNGGVQLLWPLSTRWIRHSGIIRMGSTLENNIEILLLMISLGTIILTKDYIPLFKANKKNILLLIPVSSIILPMIFRFPLAIPKTLFIPHLIPLIILALIFCIYLQRTITQ